MFDFTNVTLINSATDELSGNPKYVGTSALFRVLRAGNFKTANIETAHRRNGYAPVLSKATFEIPEAPATGEAIYRIALALELRGSEDSLYARDSVFKGKPVYIEFKAKAGETEAQISKNIVNAANVYLRDYFPYIKVKEVAGSGEDEADTIEFNGADEFVIFKSAILQILEEGTVLDMDYKDVAEGTIVNGKPGFGTALYIKSNLRLPSLENLRDESPVDMPVEGATYDQFTIRYRVKDIPTGSGVVGQVGDAITTHIFYVLNTLSSAFATELGKTGKTVTVVA